MLLSPAFGALFDLLELFVYYPSVFLIFFGGFVRKEALFENGGGKAASGKVGDDKCFVRTPVKRRSGAGLAMQGSPSKLHVLSPALGRRSSTPCYSVVFASNKAEVADNKQDLVRTPVKRRSGAGLAMQGSPSKLHVLSPALGRRSSDPCLSEVSNNSSSIQNNNPPDSCVANLFFAKSTGCQDYTGVCIVVTDDDNKVVERIQANNIC